MARPIALILVLGAVLAACSGGGSGSPTPVASDPPAESPTSAPSGDPSAAPSGSPDADPSGEPTPTPASGAADIPPETVVVTTVEGLTLRREPGTSGERIGVLPNDTMAYVLAGPEDVDGFPWYRITGMGLPYASGCITTPPDEPIACPAFQGWVAGASEAGEAWIAATDHEPCPTPDLVTISESGFTWRLVCWADEPITFEAYWPELPDDAGLGGFCPGSDQPAGFLHCQNINYNQLTASPDDIGERLDLSIDPASGLTMPERGQYLRITGSFDHPAAEGCAELADPAFEDSYGAVFACRLQFVPTQIEALGS